MDDKRHPQALLPGGITVQKAAVPAELLPMVAVDHEDSVVVEPKVLVLIEEVFSGRCPRGGGS